MSVQLWTANGDSKQPSAKSAKAPRFVWEDTPGLDHHCPVCSTSNSHPSFLAICMGSHLMPCPKYHQNLFWPNKIEECEACGRSREEHYKRHKAIVASLRELEHLEVGVLLPPPSTNAGSACALEANGAGLRMSRKEKKKAKKLHKALSRGGTVDSTRYVDITHVAEAFHPDPMDRNEGFEEEHIELDDPEFPENLSWDCQGFAWYRRDVELGTVTPPDMDEQAAAALKRLGVDVSSPRMRQLSSEQRAVINQLLDLARADFQALWNEEVETAKRRGGFLRYVTKKALHRVKDKRKETFEHATRQGRAVLDVHPEEEDGQLEGAVENGVEEAVGNEVDDQLEEAEDVDAEGIDVPTEEQVMSNTETLREVEGEISGPGINTEIREDAVVELKMPHDIPLPRPKEKERKDWEVQEMKAKFRNIIENTHIPPARTSLAAEDFFNAGVFNLHNHDIWAQPRDTPLEPLADPEKDYVLTSGHHVDPKRPRHDDWRAFMTHMKTYRHHPQAHVPLIPTSVFKTQMDVGAPAKLSSARLVVPMGEGAYMAKDQRTDEAVVALCGGAAGCPPGHLPMMMSTHIVPFVFDMIQDPPDFLMDQFQRGDGFWAEQCWQYYIIGSLNQRNLMLRDGLRREHDLELSTPEDMTRLEQLEGPVAVARTCVCGGLPTERMIECGNAQCKSGFPMHARCIDVVYAPAEGDRHLCRKCANDLVWFLVEGDAMERAFAATGHAADLEALMNEVLCLYHSDLGTKADVEWAAKEVVRLVKDSKRMGISKPEARDIYTCMHGVTTLEDCAKAQKEAEKGNESFDLNWCEVELGCDARKLFVSDPMKSANAVVRWDMTKHS